MSVLLPMVPRGILSLLAFAMTVSMGIKTIRLMARISIEVGEMLRMGIAPETSEMTAERLSCCPQESRTGFGHRYNLTTKTAVGRHKRFTQRANHHRAGTESYHGSGLPSDDQTKSQQTGSSLTTLTSQWRTQLRYLAEVRGNGATY